jgi:hypothetical protein
MSTILNDRETVQAYAESNCFVPSEKDREEFALAWRCYPTNKHNLSAKDEIAKLSVWKRAIPEEDRDKFLAAVLTYRKKLRRAQTDFQYAHSWSRFIAETWRSMEIRYTPEKARWWALYMAGKVEPK